MHSKNAVSNQPGTSLAASQSKPHNPPGSIITIQPWSHHTSVYKSSCASSKIKAMQLEARAKSAALKHKIESSKSTHALEMQAKQLAMVIEQRKIQAGLMPLKPETLLYYITVQSVWGLSKTTPLFRLNNILKHL